MYNPSAIEAGSVAHIEVLLDDGNTQYTGESPVVSVRDRATGFYFNGTTFVSGYRTVAMTELTNGSDKDVKARYGLEFTTPAAGGEYVWFVEHTPSGGPTMRFTGDLITSPAIYDARINFRANSSTGKDYWTVRFRKNLIPITSGVTVPVLTVKRRNATTVTTMIDAATLVEDDAAEGHIYEASGAERCPAGLPYEATVTATIDGATRTFTDIFGRDR